MQDSELIKKCIKGNSAAQHELYSRYAPAMMGVCYRYTKSIADAEDVLQEGFIKVFTRLQQYKSEGELGAWIRKIMVNTSISYLTKHNRYRREMQQEDAALHPVSNDNPEIYVDTKQLVELVRELPVIYQTVMNLVAVEGYSLVDAAKLLGSNENTVRSQYSRARALFITQLKKISDQTEKKKYAGGI